MKTFSRILAASAFGLAAAASHGATPKAAEDPTATVISVGTPAPRGHSVPAATDRKGKKAKATATAKGKAVKKRTRAGRK